MCANFKPLTLKQLRDLNLPDIPFEYPEEVYPNYELPLLFKSDRGLEWRKVHFGLIPKWAEDKSIALRTYNARNETLLQKPTFVNAVSKFKFGVIPVCEFYESKYFDDKPQRWGIRRKDGQAIYIAALYEICRIGDEIIRSATMITMDAMDHPMMKDFHEPGNVKRSVIIIPRERLDEWLSWNSPDIHSFVEGFPEVEFECSHVPKAKIEKISPQLNFFD
ncbi:MULTISPECIES: SOS response-associated peptidase family protein [unclassified Acinetobacter]|uniref:SOS response-associated peptidase family protein n=1 Tax=unclassified Acinetobacter TaxID=196816 RepID=UPI0025C38747|nr:MULTISPECIES: SOS response-associated peptidase family protein [unclassified Acinetobacter]